MKVIFSIITMLLTTTIYCQKQNLDSLVEAKINNLHLAKIDTVGIIKRRCEDLMTPKCGYITCYILWTKNNITYIQRINKCDTGSIKVDSSNYFFNFYFTNQSIIKTEEVKFFSTGNGSISLVDHYCLRTISIILKDSKIEKEINSYYLEKGEENHLNINYEFNNSLKIVELEKNTKIILKKLFK